MPETKGKTYSIEPKFTATGRATITGTAPGGELITRVTFQERIDRLQRKIEWGWTRIPSQKIAKRNQPSPEDLWGGDANVAENLVDYALFVDAKYQEQVEWEKAVKVEDTEEGKKKWGAAPIVVFLEEWLKQQPEKIDPETRQDSRILPAITTANQDLNRRSEVLVTTLAGAHEKPADLSFFPQAERHEVPLLDLVDKAGKPIRTRGRGAPLESRLIVAAILAVPQDCRGRDVVRFSLPLRDLVEAIYTSKWQRNNQWPPLHEILQSLGESGVRLRHRGSIWRPVFCREIPDEDARLDAPVTFDVAFPPGTTTGPQIDPKELASRGVRSSPEWRAYIAAATLAWVPGRSRVPVPRKRYYGWSHNPQAYPVLTQEDRRRLAYGETQHRRSKEKIDAVWRDIPGFTVLENQTDAKTQTTGWRIVPEQIAEELMKKVRRQKQE